MSLDNVKLTIRCRTFLDDPAYMRVCAVFRMGKTGRITRKQAIAALQEKHAANMATLSIWERHGHVRWKPEPGEAER